MKIYHNDTQILDIEVDDKSYRYRAIRGDHNLTLYFSLAEHFEIPLGAYCLYQNETYTLEKPESLKMQHSRRFDYTVVFESAQARAEKWKFRNPVDRRLKFSLTATPREHLQMFVDNMNMRDSGWSVGRCIEGPERLISYNHAFCIDALAQLADENRTEYEFRGKEVSLCKVEYDRDNPLPLSYGKGNGFKPGVGRSNYGDSTPVEVLCIQGGAQNLDTSRYKSPELLLPKSQTIRFDGVHFEDEDGFDAAQARTYATDADGFTIRRADKPLTSLAEQSLDCSHVYPRRTGTVSSVETVDAARNLYDIVDDSIPEGLDYNACAIGGETMTVIFQSGMLAGREFEVNYCHGAKNGKVGRRFELIPQQIDGRGMPDETFKPSVGDTYAVFHCMLPQAYICDDASRSGASWEMFREGVKYLYDNEEPKFTFTGELDGAWAKRDWNNIGGRIRLGGFVRFTDERFQPEGVLVRIIGIKELVNDPHSPQIELSNTTVGRTVAGDLRKIESNEVVVEEKHREALQFTKRRYRDSLETIEMLGDALLDNFTGSINPVAVQTMMMLVGDQSLQFRFVDGMIDPAPVAHDVRYDAAMGVLSVAAGTIQHMTLGIDTISVAHDPGEYRFWELPAFETPPLSESGKRYYLYAKVSRSDQTGEFRISETAVGFEAEEGCYHLLLGVLNREYDGKRSYVSLHGFTEILPGRVTTDKIVSADGETYFDLANSEIGGRINFRDGLVSGAVCIGDQHGVHAGLNGQCSDAGQEDVRIWAGSDGASKQTAPFRVLDDGSLVARKASISGNIDAESGKIGGFKISTYQIGADNGKPGMGLYSSCIRFKGMDGANLEHATEFSRAAIGENVIPPSAGGLIRTAEFIVQKQKVDTASTDNVALYVSASGCPEKYDLQGKNLALQIGKGHIQIGDETGPDRKLGIDAEIYYRGWTNGTSCVRKASFAKGILYRDEFSHF